MKWIIFWTFFEKNFKVFLRKFSETYFEILNENWSGRNLDVEIFENHVIQFSLRIFYRSFSLKLKWTLFKNGRTGPNFRKNVDFFVYEPYWMSHRKYKLQFDTVISFTVWTIRLTFKTNFILKSLICVFSSIMRLHSKRVVFKGPTEFYLSIFEKSKRVAFVMD